MSLKVSKEPWWLDQSIGLFEHNKHRLTLLHTPLKIQHWNREPHPIDKENDLPQKIHFVGGFSMLVFRRATQSHKFTLETVKNNIWPEQPPPHRQDEDHLHANPPGYRATPWCHTVDGNQKSGNHHLRLIVHPIIYCFFSSQVVVVWDFSHQQ